MKRILSMTLVLTVCFSLFSCSNQDVPVSTDTNIIAEEGDFHSSKGTANIKTLEQEHKYSDYFSTRLAELQSKWDPKNTDGEIAKLNNTRSSSHLSDETIALLNRCIFLSEQTDGKFDITLYPLTRLWGFESDAPQKPQSPLISLLISKCGMDTISVSNNVFSLEQFTMLDPSAVSNGYAADLISEELLKMGCESSMLQIEDHIRVIGKGLENGQWEVMLSDPFEKRDHFAKLYLDGNRSVSTKGSFQNYFIEDGERYCDIFDPKSGKPVDNDLVSATVICKNGIDADAFATACFVLGSKDAAKLYQDLDDIELILVLKDGEVRVTEGIADSFKLVDFNEKVKVIKR